MKDFPGVRWVLVGDDGEHDADIYTGFARNHPEAAAAIARRQVGANRPDADAAREEDPERVGETPVVRAPDGRQLLKRLRAVRPTG